MTIFRFSSVSVLLGILAATAVVAGERPYLPANFMGGRELNELCNSSIADPEFVSKKARCSTYVIGVIDGHSTLMPFGSKNPRFCIPVNAVRGQGPAVVSKWLRENSWRDDEFASDIVVRALSKSFPCGARK